MTKVMTKSAAPTAKIVLYSIDPVGTSPWPVAAMKAVMVWTASSGFQVQFGCSPAAISTIIVSPTAREIARTKDAMIPEIAAGTTIRVDTWSLGTEGIRPVAEVLGDRRHRILRDGGDGRQQHDPHDRPALRALKTPTPTPMF